jgi:hypothetical protein
MRHFTLPVGKFKNNTSGNQFRTEEGSEGKNQTLYFTSNAHANVGIIPIIIE